MPTVEDELAQIARSLAGPLALEAARGCPDTAVIGISIAEYARRWAERAAAAAPSEVHRACCLRLGELLAAYPQSGPEHRRRLIAQALALLDQYQGKMPLEEAHPPTRSPRPPASLPAAADLDAPLGGGGRAAPTWAKRLAKLGLETNRDLLYHLPRDYLPVRRIADLVDGERAAVAVEVVAREASVVREARGFRLFRYALQVADPTGRAWVTSFARVPLVGRRPWMIQNSPLALNYPPGSRLLVEGTVRRAGSLIELQFSGCQRLQDEPPPKPGALVPIYPLTDGVYQAQVRPVIRRLLEGLETGLPDPLPESLRQRYGLAPLSAALRQMHWPRTDAERKAAAKRLAFEELLVLQVALAQRKRDLQRPHSGIRMTPRADVAALLEGVLPFSLTRAQQRVIAELTADMASDVPMCRLLQGDVGSGKTLVAAAALLIAIQNGCQGALMAPTELLAEQHYLVLSRLLAPVGVTVDLLTGSLRPSQRARAQERLVSGQGQVVVGTHALIQEGVEFQRLGLVVVDEQHRFGVRQRALLRTKGASPHTLVMTATPIPRTLTLTLYGDLDVSILDEMPPGRRPVVTRWIPAQRVREAYDFLQHLLSQGQQAYVVCPLIEESEKLQAEAATRLAQELQEEVFPDFRVGLLHGAMPVAQKDQVMEAFRAGEVHLLTTTTVIEVGVDVPNATAMAIINAERFGLAQLHQLRGRVGRGGQESYCLLIADRRYDPTGRTRAGLDESREVARRRLQVMLEESDGFRIAEQDLLLRGPGEFYGTRQHGLPDFRLARLARDLGVLEEAREAALWLVDRDPALARPEHAALCAQVEELRARMEVTTS